MDYAILSYNVYTMIINPTHLKNSHERERRRERGRRERGGREGEGGGREGGRGRGWKERGEPERGQSASESFCHVCSHTHTHTHTYTLSFSHTSNLQYIDPHSQNYTYCVYIDVTGKHTCCPLASQPHSQTALSSTVTIPNPNTLSSILQGQQHRL